MQYPSKKTLLIAALALVAVVGLSAAGISYSSRTEFCLSCHEMRLYQDELRLSAHAKNSSGQEIGCAECHIPTGNLLRMVGAKAWMGLLDLYVHTVEGGENLDRLAMQKLARRFTDDANCRKCHQDLQKNAKQDGAISVEGSLAHANYLGENGQARSGCVGCHTNLAHLPPFDARIPANKAFAMKIQELRP